MTEPANAARPTLSPAEIREVLRAFGLGAASSVRSFEPGASAAPMALIEHGSDRFLLKRRRIVEKTVDAVLVENEHAIQRRLAREGVPVAIPHDTDRPTVHATGDFVYELLRFIDGTPAHPTERQASIAGETLGRIHATRAVSIARRRSSWGAGLPEGVHPNEVFERGPIDHPVLERVLGSLHDDFLASLDSREARAPHRVVLVHGDYHPANLLWTRERLDAVIDFEGVGSGDPAEELASGALFFALDTRASTPSAWAEAPDTPRLAAFVRGYASCAGAPGVRTGISPNEQPWLMIQHLVWQTLPRLYSDRGFGRHRAEDVVPFVAGTAAWIREHADGLALVIADELAAGPAEHA
jgi:Ser/Thr protein kinase RdoA (MazF antagonist)